MTKTAGSIRVIRLSEGNHLYLTRTYQDFVQTSNGKYISAELQTKLSIDRYIDQIAVIADQRKLCLP